MTNQATEIANQILKYMTSNPSNYRDWYVGITNDPKTCLFTRHNIKKHPGVWIFKDAGSHSVAREIEKYFLDNHDIKGGPGGGDDTSRFVYAYLITQNTIE